MTERRTYNFIKQPAPVIIMTLAILLLSLAARAATVSGFSDLVTRLQVSVPADHEIKFVTPTGVDALTDTIVVTFQSDYNLSAIGFGDVDLDVDNDGTPGDCAFNPTVDQKTIAASAGVGTWGAAVSGQDLTLTPPTNALAGEIPAGSCVRIRIGTNASGGVNQIINPSTAVAHSIVLSGGFGDTGTAYTLNNDSDQVTVTATVSGGGGGGGGGGGCPPTCPAPVISNVRVQNITETEADVLWDTDIAATSFVDYGTTVSYGSVASTSGTTFNHSVHLSGLTPGTLYHFRVRSAGSGTSETVSGDFTFTTLDTTAPVLSNIQAVDITGTSARITWDTDEDATSRVDYGLSEPFSSHVSDATLVNAHSLTISGLTPDTTYQYRVTSADASGNSSTSVLFSFRTLDTTPPTISGIFVDSITQSSARVNWSTNELATSRVLYGLTSAYGSTVENGNLVANHQVTLSGLAAGTLYHYSVSSYDASGNGATSTDQTFTTLNDTTPPANVTGLTVTPSDRQNALSWTNPADADFSGVRIQRSTSGYPTSPTSGTTVFNGSASSYLDTGLTNGVTYYYTVFAYDSSGNFASGAVGSGKPFDTVPPGSVTGFTVTPGDSQNTLNWTNPSDSDFSNVQIQRSTSFFPADSTQGTTVYIGGGQSYLDSGLTNGTTYYYSVFAKDTSGNFSGPAQASGTPQASPPPPPVCGDNACVAPEDATSCPADCAPGGAICGNNACEAGETNSNCPADCPPSPPPPTSVCGNAICESNETNLNCPADCPATPQPPITPPPSTATEHLDPNAIRYFALNRILRLHRDGDGFFRILPGRTLSVDIPKSALPQPVISITLNFGSGSYLFTAPQPGDADPQYWADVSAPVRVGVVSGSITPTYQDGTTETIPFEVNVERYGNVYSVSGGQQTPIAGASVLLQKEINPWVDWDASPYLQTNPASTDANGRYGFMAPQGQYKLIVQKDGYRSAETAPFDLTTEVINTDVELIEIPPPLSEFIVPGASITENIGNIARGLGAQGAYITKIFQNEVVENPGVKTATTQIIVPAAAVVTAVVTATAIQAGSLISYLYFLLTQPILLLGRRKRKEYGTVYNALTKRPVDLAIVRLIRTTTGKLVRTLVTDKQGRYAFLVDPGEYRIEASKQGYSFPTQYLKDRREDAQYLDLYHGEVIRVGEKGAIITANIPLDPLDAVKSARRLVWEEIGRRVQNVLALVSVVLTLIAAVLYRQAYLYALLAVQVALFFLFRRLARPSQPKNWGIIYDARTKKPIPFAVARIVETQYGKVLESRVTDSAGRYNFLVGNNKYVVTVEKPGYESAKTTEIDLSTGGKEGGVVSKDIALKELERKKEATGPESK